MTTRGPELIPPDDLIRVLHSSVSDDLLILDTRVFAQFSKSRIKGALNLSAPTTLLKRPAYTVKKLSETFANRGRDREKFERWRKAKTIVVYDVASWTLAQAASCVQVLQKFLNEKWQGSTYVLQGGFNAFAQQCPDDVDEHGVDDTDDSKSKNLSINPSGPSSLAGGCKMPTENSVKPFFNTIRQNMDLIGGVGQFPLRRPAALIQSQVENMPAWLRKASEPKDEGKAVADRFLAIEKAEQQRMQKALSAASWHSQRPTSPNSIRMAGIEKGVKNRYKDILPFENTRVKLREKNAEGCDYVNASHVKPANSRMHYIACQAPTPATFQDFWRVIWEQGARVIVMLTAESEEGHLKAHPYWSTGKYGNFNVKLSREEDKDLHYGPDSRPQRTFSIPVEGAGQRAQQPPLSRRHTSNPGALHLGAATNNQPKQSPDHTIPHVTIRRIQLTNTSDSSHPTRPISQVQLASWPDTGAPTRPKDILALAEICDSLDTPHPAFPPLSSGLRPLIVHCSAGCGRTGAFCTVANVKHMLKKQLAHRKLKALSHQQASKTSMTSDGTMDVDGEEWISDEEVDLVALTVSEFRLHRMSMVQTLRQFVLCYEAIMELFVHDDWCEHEESNGAGGAGGGDAMDVDVDLDQPSQLPPTTRVAKRPTLGKRAKSGL